MSIRPPRRLTGSHSSKKVEPRVVDDSPSDVLNRPNSSSDDLYLGGVRILVVDDCKHVRGRVTRMLEQHGAAVTSVGTATEALRAVERERPDVLVSDLAMPDRGGYWLINAVRALPPERGGATPAAALTAFTAPENRASILRAGFQYHIEKPVRLEKLVGIVAVLALKTELPSRGPAGLAAGVTPAGSPTGWTKAQ